MKAIVCTKYGSPEVLQLQEMKKPIPKPNEVLIRVYATTATLYDCWSRSGTAPPGFKLLMRLVAGIRKPKQPIFGTELAGKIEAVGSTVTRFKVGNRIWAYLGMNQGAYVDYICLPEDGVLAEAPTNMTYEEAAAVQQGVLTALYFLRAGNIEKGQKILIFGASGGVGSFAVQLSKYFGAEVTGIASTAKLDYVKALGADKIIDYTREDFTKSEEMYDIILDTIGKTNIGKSKKLLKKDGIYLFTTFGLPKLLRILWLQLVNRKKAFYGTLEETTEDLNFLKELIEGESIKAVIDKRFPMDQAAEAHRYVETGQKMGQVVITMKQEN
ncbi:MAG: NAD(P)-dependent alcohol dehydrogenase [Candidatus Hodarchaeales archaeon]